MNAMAMRSTTADHEQHRARHAQESRGLTLRFPGCGNGILQSRSVGHGILVRAPADVRHLEPALRAHQQARAQVPSSAATERLRREGGTPKRLPAALKPPASTTATNAISARTGAANHPSGPHLTNGRERMNDGG
jgi:hypothetical protein